MAAAGRGGTDRSDRRHSTPAVTQLDETSGGRVSTSSRNDDDEADGVLDEARIARWQKKSLRELLLKQEEVEEEVEAREEERRRFENRLYRSSRHHEDNDRNRRKLIRRRAESMWLADRIELLQRSSSSCRLAEGSAPASIASRAGRRPRSAAGPSGDAAAAPAARNLSATPPPVALELPTPPQPRPASAGHFRISLPDEAPQLRLSDTVAAPARGSSRSSQSSLGAERSLRSPGGAPSGPSRGASQLQFTIGAAHQPAMLLKEMKSDSHEDVV